MTFTRSMGFAAFKPRSSLSRATCVVIALMAGGKAFADGETPPYETVRTLQALQDRIATGDHLAQAAYAKAIQRASRAFGSVKLEVWSDKRNSRALIAYLFSGGNAEAVGAAIPRTAIAADLQALYGGALDYGLGRDDAARAALMPINAKTLPTGLGGHLALVQATLVAAVEPAKAIGLLDVARLLEPGTLVEEAALRKEMLLIGASGDLDKFALLTRRYIASFSHSIYADNFRQLVGRTAMLIGGEDRADVGGRLAKFLDGLGRDEKRRLYLAVAREAVIDGRIAIATLASEEARRLAQHSDTDEARALVYFGAASIAGPHYETAMNALAKASPEKLDARDRSLRASALTIGALIRGPGLGTKDEDLHGDKEALILAEGERSLNGADALLREDKK